MQGPVGPPGGRRVGGATGSRPWGQSWGGIGILEPVPRLDRMRHAVAGRMAYACGGPPLLPGSLRGLGRQRVGVMGGGGFSLGHRGMSGVQRPRRRSRGECSRRPASGGRWGEEGGGVSGGEGDWRADTLGLLRRRSGSARFRVRGCTASVGGGLGGVTAAVDGPSVGWGRRSVAAVGRAERWGGARVRMVGRCGEVSVSDRGGAGAGVPTGRG